MKQVPPGLLAAGVTYTATVIVAFPGGGAPSAKGSKQFVLDSSPIQASSHIHDLRQE